MGKKLCERRLHVTLLTHPFAGLAKGWLRIPPLVTGLSTYTWEQLYSLPRWRSPSASPEIVRDPHNPCDPWSCSWPIRNPQATHIRVATHHLRTAGLEDGITICIPLQFFSAFGSIIDEFLDQFILGFEIYLLNTTEKRRVVPNAILLFLPVNVREGKGRESLQLQTKSTSWRPLPPSCHRGH